MSSETVIVMPCYNEAARLDVTAFDAFLSRASDISLLMVDDGSTDGTPHELEQLRSRYPRQILVLGLGENVGKAEAVRRGIKLALRRSPAMVGYWDADLATPLEAILDFRTVLLERSELVLVMGSRVSLLGRRIRRSWKRHLLGRAFATAASLTLGLNVYDTQCGAKLFRATRETNAIFDQPFRARWIFDVEILARMIARHRNGLDHAVHDRVYEFPLMQWEDVQGSRLKSRDFLWAALDLVAIRRQYGRRFAMNSTSLQQEILPPTNRAAA